MCQPLGPLARTGVPGLSRSREKEAAERLKGREFKVVLNDMKLPAGDGTTVFHIVRQANPQARTIVITGHRSEMEQLVEKVMYEGADAVCYKPLMCRDFCLR